LFERKLLQQFQLLMYPCFFLLMILYVLFDGLLRDLVSYSPYRVTVCPKFTTPQFTLYPSNPGKISPADLPLNLGTTSAIESLGGNPQNMCTWSSAISMASISKSLPSAIG
jgi:hypothetical protein